MTVFLLHQCRLLFKQMMFDSCNDVKYVVIGEVYKYCKYINNHIFISAYNGIIMCYNSSSGCIKLNKGFRPIRTYTDQKKVNTHPIKLHIKTGERIIGAVAPSKKENFWSTWEFAKKQTL